MTCRVACTLSQRLMLHYFCQCHVINALYLLAASELVPCRSLFHFEDNHWWTKLCPRAPEVSSWKLILSVYASLEPALVGLSVAQYVSNFSNCCSDALLFWVLTFSVQLYTADLSPLTVRLELSLCTISQMHHIYPLSLSHSHFTLRFEPKSSSNFVLFLL